MSKQLPKEVVDSLSFEALKSRLDVILKERYALVQPEVIKLDTGIPQQNSMTSIMEEIKLNRPFLPSKYETL